MANLNKVFLIGNLTRDPEQRYTPGGTAVANLGLAVNRKYKDSSAELKEEVCFLSVTVWDKQAEACCRHLKKGSAVFVEGVLQSRFWETKDGEKRSAIDVRAERVQFLGSYGSAIGSAVGGGNREDNHTTVMADTAAVHPTTPETIKPENMAWEE